MIRLVQFILVLTLAFCSGCAVQPPDPPNAAGRTIVVPGVFGDVAGYNGLRRVAAAGGSSVTTQTWGLPKSLFVGNFSGHAVHAKAEADLAAVIDATAGPLDLVGHSAGCGVILGGLAKCHRPVDRVVLIAPSVSPGYDIGPALAKAARVDSFYSDRDTFFLKWRCGTFGTYDDVKSPAAGYAGFTANDPKLTQHPYDPAWKKLGHDGGHGGGTSEPFVRAIIAPLLHD